MAIIFPFQYSECLPDATLAKLPEKLKINGKSDSELLLISRLLSGSLQLEHKKTAKIIVQKKNYFSSDFKSISRYWYKKFPELIAENYSAHQFSNFVDSTRIKNRTFFKNILSELSYFIYYQNKSSHLNSFIFLYRALEHVSYAFPLIYISKTDEFSKTYVFLKELMAGEKNSGELGFFKKFIKTVYKDDPICESSIDFPMNLETEDEQKNMFNLLHSLCSKEMISDATDKPRLLSIRYLEVGSFLITIRNRFFHFMNGGAQNIESSTISDIDQLFSLLNEKLLYWLSTVLLAVISHNALEFEKVKSQIK